MTHNNLLKILIVTVKITDTILCHFIFLCMCTCSEHNLYVHTILVLSRVVSRLVATCVHACSSPWGHTAFIHSMNINYMSGSGILYRYCTLVATSALPWSKMTATLHVHYYAITMCRDTLSLSSPVLMDSTKNFFTNKKGSQCTHT